LIRKSIKEFWNILKKKLKNDSKVVLSLRAKAKQSPRKKKYLAPVLCRLLLRLKKAHRNDCLFRFVLGIPWKSKYVTKMLWLKI
jgi:hypothetical protein